MSELHQQHDDIPMTIRHEATRLVDQSHRRDKLLEGRKLTHIGERDPSFREFVFLAEAFDAMIEFGMKDRSKELAGALAGFHQGDQTIVTRFIPAPNTEGSGGQVHISPEDWRDIVHANDRVNDMNGTEDTLVAWFHTHPHNYPPVPSSFADTFIMKGYFSGNDRKGQHDHTTVIMTTYPGQRLPSLATWKWDPTTSEAVYMQGISIAAKNAGIKATYFVPGRAERRVGEKSGEFISVNLSEISGGVQHTIDDIKILEDKTDHVLNIELLDEKKEPIRITLRDADPDPNILRITVDDITPEQITILERNIREHPRRREIGILRKIVEAFHDRNPKRIEDQITIISEE